MSNVPATAPGRLADVQRFLNTLHVERGTDDLTAATPAELKRLRSLRRELRALCGDGVPDSAALAGLAAGARLHLTADSGGALSLTSDDTAGGLLAIVYEAQHDGTWTRLKICRHDGCRWAFYDNSRSRTATWCAMGVCGNRTKVAAYRRRNVS